MVLYVLSIGSVKPEAMGLHPGKLSAIGQTTAILQGWTDSLYDVTNDFLVDAEPSE